MIIKLLHFFASLKLTVVLLSLLFVLVFAATLDQVNLGIYYAVKTYFKSWLVWWVFPGGMTVGLLLFINLICAHFIRFSWSSRKIGIWLTHIGLLLLIFGSAVTGFFAQESQLQLVEGQSKNYSEDFIDQELVIYSSVSDTEDQVVAINLSDLPDTVESDLIPFSFTVDAVYMNARLRVLSEPKPEMNGVSAYLHLDPEPIDRRPDGQNHGAAIITLRYGSETKTIVLSNLLGRPIQFGEHYLTIRPRRHYAPYWIELIDFTHDRYEGTDVPRHFASDVVVHDTDGPKTYKIYMNHPLRYKGQTYYQASFGKNDKMSVLQVVKNPGWLLPYISCLVIALGMLIHFMGYLIRFLRREHA